MGGGHMTNPDITSDIKHATHSRPPTEMLRHSKNPSTSTLLLPFLLSDGGQTMLWRRINVKKKKTTMSCKG